MRSISIVLVLALLAIASAANIAKAYPYYDLDKAYVYFEQFIKDYHRVYKDDVDKAIHFLAFVENLKSINSNNEATIRAKGKGATFGITKFADYTKEEWAKFNSLINVYP
ncbi:hypothetical protein B5X24_HaOG209200 [Helicoverpa armigera]|nr:hypothetical protein B5X24_HaOG209200 [Helicoverpa armigera]